MLPAITWFLVLGLAVAWSISAWVLHALAVLVVEQFWHALAGQASIEGVTLPTSVTLWIPPELLAVSKTACCNRLAIRRNRSVHVAVPGRLAYTSGLGSLWGMGFLTLLAIGALLHAVIFATQKAIPN